MEHSDTKSATSKGGSKSSSNKTVRNQYPKTSTRSRRSSRSTSPQRRYRSRERRSRSRESRKSRSRERRRSRSKERRRSRSRERRRSRSKEGRRSRSRERRRSRSRERTSKGKSFRERSKSIESKSRILKNSNPRQSSTDDKALENNTGSTSFEQMSSLMGFEGFDTTKGKKVFGNHPGSANVVKARKYRQYMNRKGGFNRPLDEIN
ncbi:hypothetical protein BB559_000417 [Furculomyces boomerangus]|uniref:U4/U6.U5 small nuclear ribonucleoprotein 27kDa protein domain-containing protein n=1 Tax=Furculomyces boomerangus TaxID=61424 RepID=A0A2T9Z5C5_9FUNG|nr:hypothetical protein BB559_000417 [Furculomyces boomerangus]